MNDAHRKDTCLPVSEGRLPDIEKVFRRVFWFALAGVMVISIYLEWMPVPTRIILGGILGGLTGLAFSLSKKGATIGAWIGAAIGAVIMLDGIFTPIIAFDLPFYWSELLILPFGIAFGFAIGAMIGAVIDWVTKVLRSVLHER